MGEGNTWTQILIDDEIPCSKIYTYKIRLVQIQSRNIMIGVIDRKQQKNSRSAYSIKDAVAYYAANGTKYPNFGQ